MMRNMLLSLLLQRCIWMTDHTWWMLLFFFFLVPTLQAQDTLEVVLPGIEIEATRTAETEASAPFAVSVLRRSATTVALEPALSLDETLRNLPGVWLNDRSHFALGERLVVRGMGWRAAFGVRGIYVLLDGIPLTLPDGQAILDIADPAFIRGAELIRGPSSVFWGNSSGGVLFLSTDAPPDSTRFRVRGLGGSYGLSQINAEATLPLGRHRVQTFASTTRRTGYRDHSTGRFTRGGLRGAFGIAPQTRLNVMAAFADQDTESPGSLTLEQVTEDPRQADPRNVNTSAGKESLQVQGGATLLQQTQVGLFSATTYGLIRRLDNPLSFTYIDLDRASGGLRLLFQNKGRRLGWGVGADAALQVDDRLNVNNENGSPGQERSLDQKETVRSAAAFAYATITLATGLDLSLGARLDGVRFEMEDRLLGNGDQSGARTLSAVSPSLGLSYSAGTTLLFANFNTAFETPTTTELVNSPSMDGGFNPDLDPQRTRGFEVGLRGVLPSTPLRYDIALFHLRLSDQLLPFESEDGRTFFSNAGENTHQGVEAAARWSPAPYIQLEGSYTGTRLRFDTDPAADNHIPGVPSHHLSMSARASKHGLWGQLTLEAVTDYYTNQANDAENQGYAIVDAYVGHADLSLGQATLQPFIKLSNVFNKRYNGSIIVNAFGGRYFEPAPGRTIQAGLNLSF